MSIWIINAWKQPVEITQLYAIKNFTRVKFNNLSMNLLEQQIDLMSIRISNAYKWPNKSASKLSTALG